MARCGVGHAALVERRLKAFSRRRFFYSDDGEDFVFAEDEEFFVIDFDFSAGVGGEDDLVALFDLELGAFAAVEQFAVADGDDGALLGFFLGGFRQDDAGFGFRSRPRERLEQDFVIEGTNFDGHGDCSFLGFLPFSSFWFPVSGVAGNTISIFFARVQGALHGPLILMKISAWPARGFPASS